MHSNPTPRKTDPKHNDYALALADAIGAAARPEHEGAALVTPPGTDPANARWLLIRQPEDAAARWQLNHYDAAGHWTEVVTFGSGSLDAIAALMLTHDAQPARAPAQLLAA